MLFFFVFLFLMKSRLSLWDLNKKYEMQIPLNECFLMYLEGFFFYSVPFVHEEYLNTNLSEKAN